VTRRKPGRSRNIGQGEMAPEEMWVLFDMVNGDSMSRRYIWWFRTRAMAREHMKHQRGMPNAASLSGPFKYRASR